VTARPLFTLVAWHHGAHFAAAVEVTFAEGDLLILDPMLLHSASDNGGAIPSRHVLFTTFFDEAAIGTTLAALPDRVAVGPSSKFPASLHQSLPVPLQPLLDWRLPLASGEVTRDVNGLEIWKARQAQRHHPKL
jgi:ectoine hydroxylase-related dioxygenase (phytanoyl-CoA dioxygenase family)